MSPARSPVGRRKPRLLRIITRLAVSGVSTHVTLANQGLTRRGWETLLLHGPVQPDELEIELPVTEVLTRRVPTLRRPIDPVSDTRALLEITRIIRAFRPDLVHTHHSKGGLLGRTAANLCGIPVVHTFHGHVFEGYFGPWQSKAIVTIERVMATRTSRLITLGPIQREDILSRGIGRPNQFDIVPLGLDLARFSGRDRAVARQRLGIPQEQIAIVMVGRLVPIKRVDRLLRALLPAHSRYPAVHLHVIGDGLTRAALEQQALTSGLAGAVTFHGWRADAEDWFAAANVVALSSDNEGTPLSLIEAGAAARGTISTNVGGVADVVADGVTGLLSPVGDEEAFSAALLRVVGEPGLADRLGAAAPAHVARFGADRLVDDLEVIYTRLLQDRRRLR